MGETRFRSRLGEFTLERRPPAGRRPLRAWDAADDLILEHLGESPPAAPDRVLVVDDAFGALTVPLRHRCGPGVHLLSDSHVSVLAIAENLRTSGHDLSDVVVHAGPDALSELRPDRTVGAPAPPASVDVVAMRLPKQLELIEDRLRRLRGLLDRGVLRSDSTVVAGSMTRHLHTSSLRTFERVLGPTTTSLARRKARLVFCTPDPRLDPGPSPWPRTSVLDHRTTIVEYAGVHAAGRVDPGTRLMLQHLPRVPEGELAIDLGCGNGLLGLSLARAAHASEVTFVDESHLAVASAEATYRAACAAVAPEGPAVAPARFVVGDGLNDLADGTSLRSGSASTVVVNPPFHHEHALGDETAWRMFVQARRVLRPGGEIRVVGNRHLAHHAKLHRIFGNVEVVASNAKFVICRALR